MNKQFKKLTAGLLACVMTLALAGCGSPAGDNKPAEGDGKPAALSQVAVTYV